MGVRDWKTGSGVAWTAGAAAALAVWISGAYLSRRVLDLMGAPLPMDFDGTEFGALVALGGGVAVGVIVGAQLQARRRPKGAASAVLLTLSMACVAAGIQAVTNLIPNLLLAVVAAVSLSLAGMTMFAMAWAKWFERNSWLKDDL